MVVGVDLYVADLDGDGDDDRAEGCDVPRLANSHF